jgi:hypothetical protein
MEPNIEGILVNLLSKSLILFVFAVLAACSASEAPKAQEGIALEVFKSPTCGCCGKWVTHLEESGFNTTVRNQNSLDSIKKKLGVPANMQTCHTGVSADGYFFEGHIPAKFVTAFLANPPENAAGLAVPGMPAGSPGMEMGDRFKPYSVILVKKDGTTEVYAEVASLEEQHQ